MQTACVFPGVCVPQVENHWSMQLNKVLIKYLRQGLPNLGDASLLGGLKR
jgi:hypothetical protein